jgi:hypothetical protein
MWPEIGSCPHFLAQRHDRASHHPAASTPSSRTVDLAVLDAGDT